MTFINLLIHNAGSNKAFKVKKHKLCLDKYSKDIVIQSLSGDQNTINNLS